MERETSPERYERPKGLMGELGNEIPATISGLGALHRDATSEGALDKKTKELIALGMAIALRCDGDVSRSMFTMPYRPMRAARRSWRPQE